MSSPTSGDVVMDDVEYLIEEEGVDVNSDASVILIVEEEDPESVESQNVDTFSCGTCHETWTDLSEFLDHKKSCREVILSTAGDYTYDPSASEEVVHFDENMSTDVLTFDSIHSENNSNSSEQFLELDVDDAAGEGDVILQLEEEEEGEDDLDHDERDAAAKNSPPKFPLVLDEDDFDDEDNSFQMSNPLTCNYCGKFFAKKYDLEAHVRCHTGERPFRCPICGQGFTQNSNMKKHINSHKVWLENIRKPPKADIGQVLTEVVTTKGKKIQVMVHKTYECKFCSTVVQGYVQFRSHMKSHENLKVFRCPRGDCSCTFVDVDKLVEHLSAHERAIEASAQAVDSNLLTHRCGGECSASFASEEEVAFHQIASGHHQQLVGAGRVNRNKSEDQCSSSHQDSNEQHGGGVDEQIIILESETSTSTSTSPVVATDHLALKEIFILKCTRCDLAFESRTEEGDHVCTSATVERPDDDGADPNEVLLPCERCYKKFSGMDQLNFHRLAHRNVSALKKQPRTWKCDSCKLTFATAKGHSQHVLTSGCRPAECYVCQKTFGDERYLRRHLKRVHTQQDRQQQEEDDRSLMCQVCDKKFRNQFSLRSHSLIHTGENPFVCDFEQCSKSFNRRDKLKRHKLTHEESEKKFVCPFSKHTGCNKAFYRFDKLKDHVKIHGNTKIASKCNFCGADFSSAKDLKHHLDEEHREDRLLKCFDCDQTFKWEKSRQQHHRDEHGIIHFLHEVSSDDVINNLSPSDDVTNILNPSDDVINNLNPSGDVINSEDFIPEDEIVLNQS